MFKKLDQDGGGTLSIWEITTLFKENGIHMSEAEVADMFANAQRMHCVTEDKKQRMLGNSSKIARHTMQPKSTKLNL